MELMEKFWQEGSGPAASFGGAGDLEGGREEPCQHCFRSHYATKKVPQEEGGCSGWCCLPQPDGDCPHLPGDWVTQTQHPPDRAYGITRTTDHWRSIWRLPARGPWRLWEVERRQQELASPDSSREGMGVTMRTQLMRKMTLWPHSQPTPMLTMEWWNFQNIQNATKLRLVG